VEHCRGLPGAAGVERREMYDFLCVGHAGPQQHGEARGKHDKSSGDLFAALIQSCGRAFFSCATLAAVPPIRGRQLGWRVRKQHDPTWLLPVADSLASATEDKVQDIARTWSGREARLRKKRPPLVTSADARCA